jgi:hypothetical protein
MGPAQPPPAPGGARGPLIHVATRCESTDDFVEKFATLASEGALVLPASGELPIGTEGRFAIRLRDQSVVMRGRCRVTDARPAQGAPAGVVRPTLLRVALLEMEESSASIHRRLLARRRALAAAVPAPIVPEPSDPTVVSETRPEAPSPPARTGPPAPPVSALAATMIGVAPPRARAATSPLGVPRASALAEPRAPGTPFALPPNPLITPGPVMARAPGASFTLPTNPLSEMDAEQLGSFIDSTLFESDEDDATAERLARPPEPDDVTVQRPPPDEVVEAASGRTEGSAPPPPVAAPPAAEITSPVKRRPLSLAEIKRRARALANTVKTMDRRQLARRALPYAACVVVGLVVGYAIHRSSPPAPAPAVAAAPKPASSPAAVAAPQPATPAPPDPTVSATKPVPAPAAPPPSAAPAAAVVERPSPRRRTAAADDGCRVNVVTEPAEAKVSWRGKPLGTSPLDAVSIPCGAGPLTITHERYETVTRTLTAESGAPLAVSERLRRPPATLVVTSSPAGAAITLNGHPVGSAPRHIPTMRYEHVTIRATLSGYAPWTKKLYLTEATTQVNATLGGRRGR